MKNEIERKFLVKKLPDLSQLEKVSYERHFIFHENGVELRIQRKGDMFELERKVKVSEVERTRERIQLTEAEFDTLKTIAKGSILRDSYKVSDSPDISIKIYHGNYEGLVRAEVEFESVEELRNFEPYPWFGMEITNTPLVRDAELLKLSPEEFREALNEV